MNEPKSCSPHPGTEHPAVAYLEEQILTGRPEAEGGRPEQKLEHPEAEAGRLESSVERPELQVACSEAVEQNGPECPEQTEQKEEVLSFAIR